MQHRNRVAMLVLIVIFNLSTSFQSRFTTSPPPEHGAASIGPNHPPPALILRAVPFPPSKRIQHHLPQHLFQPANLGSAHWDWRAELIRIGGLQQAENTRLRAAYGAVVHVAERVVDRGEGGGVARGEGLVGSAKLEV